MASAAKKTKLDLPSTSAESKNTLDEFKKSLQTKRDKTAKSIVDYKFNKKRLRIISDQQLVADKCEGIVYWMFRDSRVQDNWSFLFAQKLALNNEVPLHVCFCLSAKYQDASLRHIDFLRKDWDEAIESREADKSVGPVEWAKPGYDAAVAMLKSFLDKRLKLYAAKRNDPTQDAISNLSPWIRFGQTSVQRVALCVQAYYSENTESVNDFLEHAIVRNELADNFCFYNPLYDSVKGTSNWAQKTLDDHRKDKRSHIYTQDELAQARTHDDIWNSAQLQMVKEGKMHTFLRMYWCKKILEWTPSPEDALKYAIYWNDHYSIDGLNPKGYVGCMWSICGLHDQAFAERSVFGKVRFMNYEGCKRKFNVNAFVARNGGKVHKYVPKK